MVEQISLSPQVKPNVIISNKLVYSSWFNSNDLRLKTKEIRKYQKNLKTS